MFKIPRINVIEGDEGYSVEVLGQTGILYSESSKSIHIYSEYVTGQVGLALFRDSINKWDPPNENEKINKKKREAIVENIRRAFLFRKIEIEIV